MSEDNQTPDVKTLNTDAHLTNFRKVQNFNKCFGVERYETPQLNVCVENPKLVKFRMGLIHEEVMELEDAIKNNDFEEVVDALSDILYVVYGMGDCIGVDLDKTFQIVHSSNMTKLCKTEEEAKETVNWYKQNKLDVYPEPDYKKGNGDYYVVYNKSTGKVLKSINYLEADLSEYEN